MKGKSEKNAIKGSSSTSVSLLKSGRIVISKVLNPIKSRGEEIMVGSFMIPMLAMIAIFTVVPSLYAIWYSLTNQALAGVGALHPRFIGFDNFRALLSDPQFYRTLIVTWEYVLRSLAPRMLIGLIIALLLNSKGVRFKGVFAGLLLLPYVLPGVIKPILWISLFDYRYGTLNRFILFLGLPSQKWLYDWAMESIVTVNVWIGYPFMMLLLTSAIASIPQDYYDVAEIYGASTWYRFRHITLPLIKYPFMLCVIMCIMDDLDDFTIPFILTGGGPLHRTELMPLYSYHEAFTYYELGYGCAVSLILAIMLFAFGLWYIKLIRR